MIAVLVGKTMNTQSGEQLNKSVLTATPLISDFHIIILLFVI